MPELIPPARPSRTASAWLITILRKLQMLNKPGLAVWMVTIFTVVLAVIIYIVNCCIDEVSTALYCFKLCLGICNLSVSVFSPLALYKIEKCARNILESDDLKRPKYWYLLAISIIAPIIMTIDIVHGAISKTGMVPSVINLPVDLLQVALSMILATVLGSVASTLSERCQRLGTYMEDDLVNEGNNMLNEFKSLKSGFQLGFLLVYVSKTSKLVLQVQFAEFESDK